MKKGIHPPYGITKYIRTDGKQFENKGSLSMKHKEYHLEMDPESHTAWTKKTRFSGPSVGNVAKIERQFPGLENLI